MAKWWSNYKDAFVTAGGRVRRPRDNDDTVSEGQAYAMLAAVLLDDRETFDKLYEWTDAHLSRRKRLGGDHLLAWHWQGGKVADWMPASDADCDFALALIPQKPKDKEREVWIAKSRPWIVGEVNETRG